MIGKPATGFLFLACTFVPICSTAQPELDLAEPGAQLEIADQVRQIELREGPNDEQLIEPLTRLALLYEEAGRHLLAAAAIRRTLDVMRIHRGLYSLDQAPLLRMLVEIAERSDDAQEAWKQEQLLLELAERHRDDLRSAVILRDSADRRIDVLDRYDAGAFPEEIVLGCYYRSQRTRLAGSASTVSGGPDCSSGSRRRMRQAIMAEAQSFYAEAVNIILGRGDVADPALPELLLEIARNSHRFGNQRLGRRSLEFLSAYRSTNSGPWPARVEAMVMIADWDLLYSTYSGTRLRDMALAEYEEAYRLLLDHAVSADAIDELFSPQRPVILPSFVASTQPARQADGPTPYVDVSFVVTRYGRADQVEVLGSSPNASRAATKRLLQTIKRARFRPIVTTGQFSDSKPFLVRYAASP